MKNRTCLHFSRTVDEAIDVLTAGCTPCEMQSTMNAKAAAAIDAVAPTQTDQDVTWSGPLCFEGEMTGDGREIAPNALKWDLPVPLRWSVEDNGAHKGAVVVGQITDVERQADGAIMGRGYFDMGSDAGREAARQVDTGLTPGVSVDLDDIAFEVRVNPNVGAMGGEKEEFDSDGRQIIGRGSSKDELMYVTDARLRGATQVSIPAFAKAKMTLDQPLNLAASAAPEALEPELEGFSAEEIAAFNWVDDAGGLPQYMKRIATHLKEKGMEEGNAIATAVNVCKKACATGDLNYPGVQQENAGSKAEACAAVADWEAKKGKSHADNVGKSDNKDSSKHDAETEAFRDVSTKERKAEAKTGDAMPDGSYPIADEGDLKNAIQAYGRAKDPEAVKAHIVKRAKALGLTKLLPESWGVPDGDNDADDKMSIQTLPDQLVAGGFPVAPSELWFLNPNLRAATPLTVDDDGRVYGHIAAWDTCHTAYPGQCVSPPSSPSGYAYFKTGSVRTKEGTSVSVGNLTLDTLHAKGNLSPAQTLAHYENTGRAVADVAAGEDSFGIWVAGALRPNVEPDQIRALRASPISGDWRRISGALELVAALAVNVPGFPIPRPQGLVAGGAMHSLVASGVLALEAPEKEQKSLSEDDLSYLRKLAARERAEEQSKFKQDTLSKAESIASTIQAGKVVAMAAMLGKVGTFVTDGDGDGICWEGTPNRAPCPPGTPKGQVLTQSSKHLHTKGKYAIVRQGTQGGYVVHAPDGHKLNGGKRHRTLEEAKVAGNAHANLQTKMKRSAADSTKHKLDDGKSPVPDGKPSDAGKSAEGVWINQTREQRVQSAKKETADVVIPSESKWTRSLLGSVGPVLQRGPYFTHAAPGFAPGADKRWVVRQQPDGHSVSAFGTPQEAMNYVDGLMEKLESK